MADRPLVDYIKQMTATGADREAIKAALASAGWSPKDTEDGLAVAYGELAQPASEQKPAAMPGAQPINQSQPMSMPISEIKPQAQFQPQMQAKPQPQPIRIEPIQVKQPPVTTAAINPQPAAGQSPVVLKSQPAVAPYNPVILTNISSGAAASKIKKSPSLAVTISVSALVILVIGGAAAWYFLMGPGATQQAAVTQSPDAGPVVVQVSNLGVDQAKNAKYIEDGKEIQLSNGVYLSPAPLPSFSASGTQIASTSAGALTPKPEIYFSKAVLDDLNADGNGDAAVILRKKDGLFEIPQLAVLLNQGGQPNFSDVISFPSGTIVRAISSDHGTINVSMLEKASGTQAVYPDQEVTQAFTMSNGKLLSQNPIMGMRVFNHSQISDFEGRSFLVYQFSYPDSDMVVKMENQNRILVSEKTTSLNHSLTISYEGARGYSPLDYWSNVLKKSCSGCAVVSSTSDVAVMGSLASSSAIIIPGIQNSLTIENKTNKWVIWASPAGTARLFIAQLQKPTAAIEKVLQTFKFVDSVDSGAGSSPLSFAALSSYFSSKGAGLDTKAIKDVSEISLGDRAVIFSQSSKLNQSETAYMTMDGGVWKPEQ